jgi:hypothetical protein
LLIVAQSVLTGPRISGFAEAGAAMAQQLDDNDLPYISYLCRQRWADVK